MVHLLLPALAAVLVIAAATAVLVRRDRRRMDPGADTLRIEATATRGARDARRRAAAYGHRFLRDRD
ncbi:hypothetical protein [Streptomyces fructofermentans]|uniref:hypothetical protein n=1 Tax=Streptomyces fructofermentans TaxID=152141 RepID=UPI00379A65FC